MTVAQRHEGTREDEAEGTAVSLRKESHGIRAVASTLDSPSDCSATDAWHGLTHSAGSVVFPCFQPYVFPEPSSTGYKTFTGAGPICEAVMSHAVSMTSCLFTCWQSCSRRQDRSVKEPFGLPQKTELPAE
jgi:hypothetical protein